MQPLTGYQLAPTLLGIISCASHQAPSESARPVDLCDLSVRRRMNSYISEIFGNNRRRVIRRKVRLPASLSLINTETPASSTAHPPSALGYTRDISAEGLALIVPSILLGDYDLSSGELMLRIILALPTGNVELRATVVRHERLEQSAPDIGYLIGLSITEMSEADRTLYAEYLHTLGGE